MPIPSRHWPAIVAVVVLIVHGAVVLGWGIVVPPDSVKFAQWADLLIANQFDFAAVIRTSQSMNLPPGLYMPFVLIVAFAKLIAGARWAVVLVSANLVLDALSAAILVRLVLLATRSTGAALLAITAWLVSFDLVTWVRMPLTDVPFLFLSLAAFASLAAPRLAGERFSPKAFLRAALLTVGTLLLRPVGFLWILLLAVVELVLSRRVRLRHVATIAVLVASIVFAGHTFVVRHPERWPLDVFARSVRWDARSYQRGDVINGRPETSHRQPSTTVDYAEITADRFLHFFAFSAASFSRAHKIAGALFYCPLYLLVLVGTVAAALRKSEAARIALLSAMIVVAVAFWHSLVIVDFDWRYRLPVLPYGIFIAACAVPLLRDRLTASGRATTSQPTL